MRADANRLSGYFEREKITKPLSVAKNLFVEIDQFKKKLPIIRALCTEGLKERHISQIVKILDMNSYTGEESLTTFADAEE